MKAREFERFVIRTDSDAFFLAGELGLLLQVVGMPQTGTGEHSRLLVVGPLARFDLFSSRSPHPYKVHHAETCSAAEEALLRLQELL